MDGGGEWWGWSGLIVCFCVEEACLLDIVGVAVGLLWGGGWEEIVVVGCSRAISPSTNQSPARTHAPRSMGVWLRHWRGALMKHVLPKLCSPTKPPPTPTTPSSSSSEAAAVAAAMMDGEEEEEAPRRRAASLSSSRLSISSVRGQSPLGSGTSSTSKSPTNPSTGGGPG